MHFYEIELMERIQKFNLAEQMRYISKPFNTVFFYYYNYNIIYL